MTETRKVFEFAKEIGIETLALMDKLKSWEIQVKNHMASLDAETMNTIREKLSLETQTSVKEDDAAKKKKAAATKKTAAAKPAAKAPAAKTAVAKPVKKVAVKKAAEVKEEVVDEKAAEKAAAAAAAAGKRVIRRTAASIAQAQKEKDERKEAELQAAAEEAAANEAAILESQSYQEEEANEVAEEAEAAVVEAPEVKVKAPDLEKQAAPAVSQSPKIEKVSPSPAVASPTTSAAPAAREPVSKKVLKPQNIVGRMDLSRVQAQGPAPRSDRGPSSRPSAPGMPGAPRPVGDRPAFRGGGAGGPGGDRPSRPGMPGAPGSSAPHGAGGFRQRSIPMAIPLDLEGAKAGKDRIRKKLTKGGAGSASDDAAKAVGEEENLGFNKQDFLKREAIFQPKKMTSLNREAMKTLITTPKASKRVVRVDNTMSVQDLAMNLKIKPGQIVTYLMKQGMMVRMTDNLDFDTISLIATEHGYEALNVFQSVDDMLTKSSFGELDAESITRPPVVTIMGHVDHGKTSLLDAIRKADVASGEAGGITQHIAAYQVKQSDGTYTTFLDTPGHEAFTAMRARGANLTDIAVIVVAADDGLMPQTAEAINHAKAAGVPIIVALNKMDRPNANPDRVKQQLTEFELVPEEWGGTTMYVPTSAVKSEGITELLEAIHLQAEVLELKANPKRSATGIVVESRMEKGRGIVATILIKDGTLRKGDYVVAGASYGRVRAMVNDHGKDLKEAGPGTPAEILGLDSTPNAGDKLDGVKDEAAAREVVARRQAELRQLSNSTPSPKMSLEDLFSKVQAGDTKDLPVILKTDVAGSIEAIRALFEKTSTEKVKVKIIHCAVGGITESDVLLASTANAMIVGFNVRPDSGASISAKNNGIQIKTYNVIYNLADDIRNAMRGVLAPKIVEESLGKAEVRQVFKVSNVGTIAGSFVIEGKLTRDALVRLVRDGKVIYDGKLAGLRRFKDSVREVQKDFECGISIENYNDLKVGDIVEAYRKTETEAEL